MPNDNGKSPPPPESLHFERTLVECRNCGRTFLIGFIFEEIDGLTQVRIGDGLVELLKLRCLHCAEIFNWSPTEKALRQQAADYHELLIELTRKDYNPE